MDQNFLDEVKENCIGYAFGWRNPMKSASTVNEMLHYMHASLVNNDHFLQSIPLLDEKINVNKEPISLSTSLNDEDDGTVEDLVADPNADRPDDRIDNELLGKALNTVLNTLDKREKEIVVARFGLGKTKAQTLDQLGEAYGLTKERIRQIEQKALKKLRNPMRANALKAYL